ncbi:MAG: anti-sigma factor [Burkholderiales bacterium]|nr:anti-sigma factor [Burkholderiales bacterium]
MNFKDKPLLQQKLAAEYVLGTLRGGARRRFESWMQQDAALHQVVREWQANLMPMAEFSSATAVPASVWQALAQRLKLQPDRWAYWRNLRQDLSFWRGLGMVSTTTALVLVSVLLSKQAELSLPSNNYVATLTDEKAQAVAVISSDSKKRQLLVRFVTAQAIPADKSLELWAVAKDGKVKSLGLVANTLVASKAPSRNPDGSVNNTISLALPDNLTPESIPLLAVTLEPKGGSGNPEKPSGPIIFKGSWLRLG